VQHYFVLPALRQNRERVLYKENAIMHTIQNCRESGQ
jgi:hypothetical protein